MRVLGLGSLKASDTTILVTLADVERAREIVTPVLHRTPLFSSRSLSERIGTAAYLKTENFQRTGSFKPRGAVYAVSKLSSEQRNRGIVTMSAGNAAQAIAFAARTAGVPVTVAMPQTAPQAKVDATRGYGAEIVFAPDMTKLIALVGELKDRSGAYFLHPYDDAAMIAGHGTCALEVLDDLPDADVFVVGVGGGGLIAGIAVAVAARRPGARVVGVEPTDAAARGNPGPAGAGAVLYDEKGKLVAELARPLGHATNNVAEYSALILGLEEAQRRRATAVDVRMDSLLVVQQMRGLWRIKHPGLVPLALRAGALLASFREREIRHVPREENAAADELSNRAIDEGEISA